MTRNLTIKLKAFFLLFVFTINTAVGFTCALSVDMGSNSLQHSKTNEALEVHVHDDGKKHVHEKASVVVASHVHEDGIEHQHNNASSKQNTTASSDLPTNDDGGCCANEVQKFQDLDKNVSVNIGISVPVFIAMLSTYFKIEYSTVIKTFPANFKARLYYPPPPNILIVIQRFQI